ncbi:amino acid/amide ABC transporter membrane protein 1 (HAAT family) [Kribbella amoyensis]|uniref:Amino acid/amide ABC transporter membrane protein 1 (HAAT family) n=1 Tax=Kribbella amoyensis TaxID=996641 RepID=A0A561B800_9ACTN|nr:branched-chain amino acid ABC transporter permease [Kribbella amoyensis]TWD75091.1 amino acid/amide ABC transporter membrane protein 1 (HAAT family) [Kribbella amoyensis]
MTGVLQSVLDALSVGSMYALLALGLTLVFSVMNLINFAYGLLLVWTAYGVVLLGGAGLSFWLVVPLTILLATALSLLMGFVAFRPFIGAPQTTLLITSFGVLLVTQYVAVVIFGEAPRVLQVPEGFNKVLQAGDLRMPVLQLLTIGAAALTVLAFYLLLNRTPYGAQLRAAAELPDVARLMGIRPNRVLMIAFAISGVIAGIVGVLWFAKVGAVTPRSDLEPTLKAFIALVLGGLGRPAGAIYGGLLLGAIEVTMSAVLPGSAIRYTSALVFALVIAMLLARPQGVAGGKAVEV